MGLKKCYLLFLITLTLGCQKDENNTVTPQPVSSTFTINALKVNDIFSGFTYKGVNRKPRINLVFAAKIDTNTIASSITIKNTSGSSVPYSFSILNSDSVLVIQPKEDLNYITKYTIEVTKSLSSDDKRTLQTPITLNLTTAIDSTDKFPDIDDQELLSLIQKQTFKYFWDFAHPVSGLARERNTSGDVVTTGGSGFGILALIVAIERGFISRQEGLERMIKIVGFLKNNAQRFHGAFPHWLNGATGKAIPFSPKDDGADIVETSYLIQALLTARQYFNLTVNQESDLRNNINEIWNAVEWSWFRNNENVLYWHWSPTFNWEMNHQINGWNEALITYILAASSTTHSISKEVYDNGWTDNGKFKNGNVYFGTKLPLGPPVGGPLFLAHYSFLGINPNGLTDNYANYLEQNTNHTMINFNYCKSNPNKFYGYSDECWGLTASDDGVSGYLAHAPNVDNGTISPTAAISSLPYTPEQSMKALKFYYYKMGDKLWKEYGFVDAFNLNDAWFADSFLAIDQGPIIIMIENYRTGLLWNLFMSCPEIKTGMSKLDFKSPHLK